MTAAGRAKSVSMEFGIPALCVSGRGICLWNFGNTIAGITTRNFGRDAEYGAPDTARFGGTIVSKVLSNPALGKGCKAVT